MQNWDDLRYILAVARAGSITEGAKALRVDPTTVSRRLRALQDAAGTRLFDKLKHGVVLTQAGEEMVAVASSIEELHNGLDARIHGLDTKLAGPLRVTATGPFLSHWMPDFRAFGRRYPDIDLELTPSASVANLTRREADVAVRVAREVPDYLVGAKHAEVYFAVYGSADLVDEVGPDADYGAFPWVSYDLSIFRATDNWLAANAPDADIVLRVSRIPLMVEAVAAGIGVTILPTVTGDGHPGLRRVGDYLEGGLYLWVLTHPELRGSGRVRAMTRFLRELIARDQDLIEGRAPKR